MPFYVDKGYPVGQQCLWVDTSGEEAGVRSVHLLWQDFQWTCLYFADL